MKITKKLQVLFNRWNVTLRKSNTDVTHAVYRTTRSITPQEFAVYELVMKASAAGMRLSPTYRKLEEAGHNAWYENLARRDGFALYAPPDCTLSEAREAGQYGTSLIVKAGLYRDLLD